MKAILEYNLPEESEEYKDAMNGAKYRIAFDEVWNRIFRPRNKHGYSNPDLRKYEDNDAVNEFMELLEEEYRSIVREIED